MPSRPGQPGHDADHPDAGRRSENEAGPARQQQQPELRPASWKAVSELAELVNSLATQVDGHDRTLRRLSQTAAVEEAGQKDPRFDPIRDAEELRTWVAWLCQEYRLQHRIGPVERWETTPPVRNELAALKIAADHALVAAKIGPFEPSYWHEVLTRTLDRIAEHYQRYEHPDPDPDPAELRAWVAWLCDEYGLHTQIGPAERWQTTPPVRNELAALKTAADHLADPRAGSFETIYWHDALTRVLDRVGQHYDRWQQDHNDQEAAERARHR